jgi:hypothetical protein
MEMAAVAPASGAVEPSAFVLGSIQSITLAEMVRARMETAGTSGTTGGFGLGQPAAITPGSGAAVPVELLAYGNGRIPRELLTPIGIGQHRLWRTAAEAFKSMRAAAAAVGVSIGVTDSYRSYDQQVVLAAQKGLSRDGGFAATPGTSEHGWGLAVDVDVDRSGLAWLRANGGRFGFVEANGREPWHWEYHGAV